MKRPTNNIMTPAAKFLPLIHLTNKLLRLRPSREMREDIRGGNGGFVRADQIDLKNLDEQLNRPLAREKNGEKQPRKDEMREIPATHEWGIDPSKLLIESLIARAACGTVHRGIYDGLDVAVKLLDCEEESHRTQGDVASIRAAFAQEVSMWHKLDHPNVAKFIGATMAASELNIQKDNSHFTMPHNVCCLVVEYLPGATLKSFLIMNRRRKLAFNVVVQLALDLARGLSYLHSKKIIHGDVKTENTLLDKDRTVKIADFRAARVESSNPDDRAGETGTLGYMAPEVLNGNPYNRKCDVYSFGICLWEIFCCDIRYPNLSFAELTSAVVRENLTPDIPRCCPKSLAIVMKRCWNGNPEKRPEMDEVVSMLEALDTSRGKGMIPLDQSQRCCCLGRFCGGC